MNLAVIRQWLSQAIAPAPPPQATRTSKTQTRMYHAARPHPTGGYGWGPSMTSADSELHSSLVSLRARSRQLVRDSPYAKRAKVIVVNNVVGSGMGMQAQVMSSRDVLRTDLNDAIEWDWFYWTEAERCHTGGQLHFNDLERLAMGEIFEAGEIFIREHYSPFGDSAVPYALEVIEPERIADELKTLVTQSRTLTVRLGIEQDYYGRPQNYLVWRNHPGILRSSASDIDKVEVVPASQMIHLRLIDRWPQSRGEPWLHAVARKLNDMDGYSEAEIIAARGAANYMATIETPDPESPLVMGDGTAPAGEPPSVEMGPGAIIHGQPGEKWNWNTPNRPNSALDPFMRYMLREVAAGVGVSYESLSKDYSQSNYSSSRLALLDDRDLWRMLQQWFIRAFRHRVHKHWLQQAVLSRTLSAIRIEEYASDPKKFEAVAFKPRGWGWIDPAKEVEAYKEARKAGLTTRADIIAATADGRDLEDIDRQLVREERDQKEKGLVFDTDPEFFKQAAQPAEKPPDKKEPPAEDAEDDATKKPALKRVF